MPGQRHLLLEFATEQWRLFFTPGNGGIKWNSPTTPWLDWWIDFMENHWKRPVNKDLWEQAEEFVQNTKDDETLGFWNPVGAWPSAIDEFVEYVRNKRSGRA
jgi:DCN1-like protein 1/2